MSLIRSFPGEPHIVLSQHPVGLEGQLIDVSLDPLIGAWVGMNDVKRD